jgi:hypothetical protein
MKKIFLYLFLSLLIFIHNDFSTSVVAREITNIQWNKSVAKGKKLKKFRETVTSPALGKKAWKITLLPRDCGNDGRNTLTVKIMARMLLLVMVVGDRARSEYSSDIRYTGEKWISVSIYLPNDFKSVEPVSTSLFQIYEWGKTR